ncbi:MAG: DnaB-like helicase C-terminal domain-containing protein [Helicobacteraceae bacterium]|nr:DnaB-like helicase C-terminal domain-containing protein [Helicobacteraceae bacterium]
MSINKVETDILAGMIEYPHNIAEFLSKCPHKAFSIKGKECLALFEKIGYLSLNKNIFFNSLPEDKQQDEFIIEILASLPNPNYVEMAPFLIESYYLNLQSNLAFKMAEAARNKQLLDVSMLLKEGDLNTINIKTLDEWAKYYKEKAELPKIPTKVDFIDSILDGGIEMAQLVLISGDPEAGKTTLGLNILENISYSEKVGFFCFEFTARQYVDRKIKKGDCKGSNIFLINDGYDMFSVSQNIKKMAQMGVRIFLIDSQLRLTAENMGNNEEQKESAKFSTLAKLCHTLEIVIILIVQTSKTDKDNPMGSKKGGHESSITIRLEHKKSDDPTKEYSDKERFVIFKKNKQTGKHFKEEVNFDPINLRFSSKYFEKKEIEIIYDYDEIKKELIF